MQQSPSRYDEATKPVVAPYSAACLQMPSKGCECYTQQGTKLPTTPEHVCMSIVKHGFFIDWQKDEAPSKAPAPRPIAGYSEPPALVIATR